MSSGRGTTDSASAPPKSRSGSGSGSGESRVIKVWGVKQKGGKLEQMDYEMDPLTATGVEIEVYYCGLNRNDIHLINGDWAGCCAFPHVPGHEIAGIVREIGSGVKCFHVGDRVGLGFIKEACLECDYCVMGHENQCDNMKAMSCPSGKCAGGLAPFIRADQSMVTRLPDNLSLASAAPLMAGGASVWSPLTKYSKENDRVGVLGFGALGHLAVKFARMRGQPVCVFDHNGSKEKMAMEMGASHFLNTTDTAALSSPSLHNKIDLMLVFVENIDVRTFLPLMRKNATICILAASNSNITIPIWPDLLYKQLQIVGSYLSGRAATRSMLQVCSKNHVSADVHLYPLDKCNDAIEDMKHERVPFGPVIQIKQEPTHTQTQTTTG